MTNVNNNNMIQLFTEIGFSNAATTFMINDQGLNSPKVLANLEEKEITSLCKLCRKPGGTVEANQTQRRNQGSQSIPNPGVPVALIHENNLKLAVFYLKYLVMTSRPLDVDMVSMQALQGIQDFKKRIDNMENPCPTTAPKLTNKEMFEFFSDFRDFLSDNIGPLSKRPLSYVVREHDAVQQHLGDLEFGRLGSPYKSISMRLKTVLPSSNSSTVLSLPFLTAILPVTTKLFGNYSTVLQNPPTITPTSRNMRRQEMEVVLLLL